MSLELLKQASTKFGWSGRKARVGKVSVDGSLKPTSVPQFSVSTPSFSDGHTMDPAPACCIHGLLRSLSLGSNDETEVIKKLNPERWKYELNAVKGNLHTPSNR